MNLWPPAIPRPAGLDGEERLGYEEIRRIARDDLAPIAGRGSHGEIDRTLIAELAATGLLGRLFPADGSTVGCGEATAVTLCLLREAIATESPEAETALALQGLGSYPILQSASSDVAARWIPGVARGTIVPAFALTEPEAGSDAAALRMRAERDGDGWRLTGVKKWISNAPHADVYTVFARTTRDAGARGVSAFIVPGDAAGVGGVSLELLAPHPIGTLELDGVFVPADHLLGEVDQGFRVAMRTLDRFRPSVGAFAVGMAQAALEAAVAYADERHAFGGPLRDMQAVGHKLADMTTATHAARLMVLDAARAFDAGGDRLTMRSSMAKLFATETAQRIVDDAIQIHGAVALQQGHVLERLYRDVRAPRIYEGASEVQRSIIARRLYD